MQEAATTSRVNAAKAGAAALPRKVTEGGAAYFEAGVGEDLILIHGVGMRLEAWKPQIEIFSKTHRVIAVDMPGHGGSERLPAGSTLKDFVGWFGRFLDDMRIARANVAGHSMGALISGGAAATFGDQIARVGYLNGVYRRDPAAKAAVLARAAAIRTTGVDKEGPLLRWFGDDPKSQQARGVDAGLAGNGRSRRLRDCLYRICGRGRDLCGSVALGHLPGSFPDGFG